VYLRRAKDQSAPVAEAQRKTALSRFFVSRGVLAGEKSGSVLLPTVGASYRAQIEARSGMANQGHGCKKTHVQTNKIWIAFVG
jgi:hypothetical protein